MPLLWFASSTSGNATIPSAALGQADGTYTSNSGGSSWTHRWAFAPFERPLDPSANAPLVLHMRRSVAANNPTLEVVRYYDGASLLGSYTLNLAINSSNWTHEISLPAGNMSGIADHLAERHQTTPDMVRFEGGEVIVGDTRMSFADAAKSAWMARVSLSATGFYKTPKLEWDRIRGTGRPFFYFAYGCAVTEVAIDTLTGENRILRADVLHDCGASLNPALDLGQIEGAYVQGAGWLTTEELVWDEHGRLRTHAPSTYKIPACSDRPDVFNVTLWDGQNREDTIYRSKAVGEPPFMLGISAWLALSDAVASCGAAYPALNAPATAEEVWRALGRVRHGV